jgi:hypothetical protein
VLGWPKICKLAHAFLWEYSHKRLELAQLLGQLGVFLTLSPRPARCAPHRCGERCGSGGQRAAPPRRAARWAPHRCAQDGIARVHAHRTLTHALARESVLTLKLPWKRWAACGTMRLDLSGPRSRKGLAFFQSSCLKTAPIRPTSASHLRGRQRGGEARLLVRVGLPPFAPVRQSTTRCALSRFNLPRFDHECHE